MKMFYTLLLFMPLIIMAQGIWQPEVRLTNLSSVQRTRVWDNGRNITTDSQDRIYVALMDERESDADIYVKKFENGSWQNETQISVNGSDSRNPTLLIQKTSQEELLWIAWVDNSSGQYEAYFRRYNTNSGILTITSALSVAGGSPVVYRPGTDMKDAKSGISLISNADGSKVYAFYANEYGDDSNGGPNGKVIMREFSNGSFGPEIEVTDANDSRFFPFAIMDNINVINLSYNAVMAQGVWFSKKDANGWSTGYEYGTIDQDVFVYKEGNSWLALDGQQNVHFTWKDNVNDFPRKIYYRKYTKSTGAWSTPISYNISGIGYNEYSSILVDASNRVWLFWNYQNQVNYATSDSWSSNTLVSLTSASTSAPVCAVDNDNNVLLVWSDNRNNNWDVYYKKMDASPFAPTNLNYTASALNHPILSWTPSLSKDITSYKIYRNTLLIGEVNSSTTSYIDYDLVIDPDSKFSYTYLVKAVDAVSQISNPSNSIIIKGTMMKQSSDIISVNNNYNLLNNYPNPFNPATTIRYSIAEPSFVQIRVFDTYGEEITTLVNDYKNEGLHEIEFNATNISSGTYFYQLKTDHFLSTKKMQLIK